jgi:leucyl/phenylalanyl-tRNA---protein transferase
MNVKPSLVLQAYAAGIFPMADSANSAEVYWVDPRHRGILPLDGFHIPRRLKRSFLTSDFEIRLDTSFPAVVAACAERSDTWINPSIVDLYDELHFMGHAHSVEIWRNAELVGGLYGVKLGAAFFGESMFSRISDASKFALIALTARLRRGGFRLLDTQFITEHLMRFGAIEISRAEYQELLRKAIARQAEFGALPLDSSRHEVLQLCTHTS